MGASFWGYNGILTLLDAASLERCLKCNIWLVNAAIENSTDAIFKNHCAKNIVWSNTELLSPSKIPSAKITTARMTESEWDCEILCF